MEDFFEYLEGKRIDPLVFKKDDSVLFSVWEKEFMQMHPKSFTSQKLYLINNVRRRYPLPVERVKQPIKKAKAAVTKPMSPKKKMEGEVKAAVRKPKLVVGKPVIKLKVEAEGTVDNKEVQVKPRYVVKNPIVKDKISKLANTVSDHENEITSEKTNENATALKPKIGLKKPMMKPKVPVKKAEAKSEVKKVLMPKIPGKPSVLKPKNGIKKTEEK